MIQIKIIDPCFKEAAKEQIRVYIEIYSQFKLDEGYDYPFSNELINEVLKEKLDEAEAERQKLVEAQRLAEAENQRLAEEQRLAEAEKQRLAEEQRLAEAERKRQEKVHEVSGNITDKKCEEIFDLLKKLYIDNYGTDDSVKHFGVDIEKSNYTNFINKLNINSDEEDELKITIDHEGDEVNILDLVKTLSECKRGNNEAQLLAKAEAEAERKRQEERLKVSGNITDKKCEEIFDLLNKSIY